MSEEDQTVGVTALPKFDMPSYESEMTSKDVKSLALRHGIPLDLHPVALRKGWTMDKLSDDMIGLYEQYFEFSGIRVPFSTFLLAVIKHFRVHISQLVPRAISDAMAWRHHDSNVNDPVPEGGFHASDVQLLTEQVVDLRPIPSGLPFQGGLATTWDFPGFRPVFKDTEGNDHQKRVEVEDPKIVAIRERKVRAATKTKEKKRHGNDGGEGSHPKTKRRKTIARQDGPDASEATSSPRSIRTFDPTKANPSSAATATAESQEDRSPFASPCDLTAHFVNHSDGHHVDEGNETL
ncbi:hypothetical protein Tco_1397809 [Tanacetum coccineum]